MKPTRVIHFGVDAFGTEVVCWGEHLAMVVSAINKVQSNLCWYAADVQCTGYWFMRRAPIAVRVGDTTALTDAVLQVDQFISGVFLGVPSALTQPRFREDGIWTDDDETADLGDAVVEIRTFDTTYISVASRDEALLHHLESEL